MIARLNSFFARLAICLSAVIAITASPVSGVVPGDGYKVETFATQVQPPGQQGPNGLAFDSFGNLFVATGDYLKILKIPVGTNVPAPFGAIPVGDADGVVVDSQDNIIVSGYPVTKFSQDGTVIWQRICSIGNVQYVTVDNLDNVYVGSLGSEICKISPEGSIVAEFGGFGRPSSVAIGPDGFLYVCQLDGPSIVKASPDTGEILGVVVYGVWGIEPVFDDAGDMIVGDRYTHGVLKISMTNMGISTVASGFADAPSGLALDAQGNLFASDWIDDIIYKISDAKISVVIDIKPGSYPNCFNNNGNGVIPVAIMGSDDFEVTQVDPGTVELQGLEVRAAGKSNKLLAHIEDVNIDGFDDLVVQIEDVDGSFTEGTTSATLNGQLFDGTDVEGTDEICIVPSISDGVPAPESDLSSRPVEYKLFQNHPNPFNSTTEIGYDLAEESRVSLRIYDASGRLVRILRDWGAEAVGHRRAVWDGRDEEGRTVSSGIYFCRIEAGSFSETKRLIFLK